MRVTLRAVYWIAAVILIFCSLPVMSQVGAGELHVKIRDTAGEAVQSIVTIMDSSGRLHRTLQTDRAGNCVIRALPFGWYTVSASAPEFHSANTQLQLRSALSVEVEITLSLATIEQTIEVSAVPSQLTTDPQMRDYVSDEQIRSFQSAQIARTGANLVSMQPGWILESNGVLHPRGSEYQTQWVVDGFPVTDNRSPAFVVSPDLADAQSFTVWTAGYPAEYGRKLGGVIEVASEPPQPGFRSDFSLNGGSFGEVSASAVLGYGAKSYDVGASVKNERSSRFLDPPLQQNFNNDGVDTAGSAWVDLDPTAADRLRFAFDASALAYHVPNLLNQQEAGQDQQRGTTEFDGRITYQRVLSPKALLNVRSSIRDLSSRLDANVSSTPIRPAQQRGFSEAYDSVIATWELGRQEWSAGADLLVQWLHESFSYDITDPSAFDPVVPRSFGFHGRAGATEPAVFLQDRITFRNWSIQAGIRWDGYHLIVDDHAWSPRFAVVWHSDGAKLSVHASYDRVFQTPASENLLLSSSFAATHLTTQTTGLPVLPSHANFFEIGAAKMLGHHVRLDVSWYDRRSDNFADDDTFLNSGISFPISFRRAHIYGVESKLRIPEFKRITLEIAYSNMVGRAQLPITGGLLLEDSPSLFTSRAWIPITQDQRNTVAASARYRVLQRFWLATTQSYSSGLPFEESTLTASGIDPQILRSVDFERKRVRPFYSLDLQSGLDLHKTGEGSLTLEASVTNVLNSFHLINFAGALSDTALGLPRSYSIGVWFRSHR